MNEQNLDWQEKIRQQFEYAPYPRMPIESSPKEDYNLLFTHSLATPYHLSYREVIDPRGKVILDAGCGSGCNALVLAEANPGAKIVGIDLSEESIKLSRLRLQYHGFDNAEFHVLSLEDIAQLGMEFDYINCDEMLYLLPDPVVGLKAMKSVLKERGFIRANLHNYLQRESYYQAQDLFRMMGLMENNPEDFELECVKETMTSLKNTTKLKVRAWAARFETQSLEESKSEFLMNYLFQQDKGFSIPELFSMLKSADLEFVSMLNWNGWNVKGLFKSPDQLPEAWAKKLEAASTEEQLEIYNLINPVDRLFDFWCTHSQVSTHPLSPSEWSDADWMNATVHLHPTLSKEAIHRKLSDAIATSNEVEISQFISLAVAEPLMISSLAAATLLPLWQKPQSVRELVNYYRQLKPLDWLTVQPTTEAIALQEIKHLCLQLDTCRYVLLESGLN